jgi:hypothetical protein
MKKYFVFAVAVLLVFAFTLPAAAVEHQFGGYWRTRFFTEQNWNGEDALETSDTQQVDTRTRLYYTAVLNDNLKLVNKFEMDAVWGGAGTYGDIGADQIAVEVKNSYADFNISDWNFKVGVQGINLGRGLLFNDDFAGVVATYKGDNFTLPLVWIKAFENSRNMTNDDNEMDVDIYAISPSFQINDVSVNPFFAWETSENLGSGWAPAVWSNDINQVGSTPWIEDIDLYYVGVNLDYKTDDVSVWGTFIYLDGQADVVPVAPSTQSRQLDISAYVIAAGASTMFNDIEVHGQVIYATGDDNANEDIDSWFATGQSYYWAEIMGYGLFGDNKPERPANCPGDQIGNLIAYNLGTKFSPMDKLTITFDLWNAQKEEDDANGESQLGFEIDLKASYELVEGLKMDLVGAYLFAGDALYFDPPGGQDNSADPWELGMQLSLSF